MKTLFSRSSASYRSWGLSLCPACSELVEGEEASFPWRVPSDLEQALVVGLRSWVRRSCHLPLPPTLVRPLDLTSGSLDSLGCSRHLQKEGCLQRIPGERLPPIPSTGLGKWRLREHAGGSGWQGCRLGLSDPSPTRGPCTRTWFLATSGEELALLGLPLAFPAVPTQLPRAQSGVADLGGKESWQIKEGGSRVVPPY